ncbi:MAG: hypothetical protein CMB49_03880 [Euryarchaeota archaeon]|nr:hypothetical protein [Euryarchaeota archaeon]
MLNIVTCDGSDELPDASDPSKVGSALASSIIHGKVVKAAVMVEVTINMASSRLLIGLGAVALLIAWQRDYTVFEQLAEQQ